MVLPILSPMANSPSLSLVRDPARPKKLGRYELEECLGAEGGHETYRARVRGLAGFDRIFAVKCLRRSSGLPLSHTNPFVVAAKRLATIADSRVARLLDTDVVDGVAIAVSEFVHGLDLERFREWAQVSGSLATGGEDAALHWQKLVAYIGAEIAGALTALHALTPPLVHGGLSPRNVVATARGGIKVLDAGLSVAAQKSGEPISPRTLAYASPLPSGAEPTAADDVRALGAMLFELATGELPPQGVTRAAAKSLLEPLWPAMAEVLASMLAEEPATRPRPAKVAELLGNQWADVTDAAMATEMATLVRSFSAFVAESPPGSPPASATPEPVPTAKAPPAASLLSMAPPPAPQVRPSGSFLSTSDERTVVNPDERYATAMFQALAADAPSAPAAKDRAGAAGRALSGSELGADANGKPTSAAVPSAGPPKLSQKRPAPGMRNAAPPVTARTLVMSPAPAVPPQVVPSPPQVVPSVPRPAAAPPPLRTVLAPLAAVPPPAPTAPSPLATPPRSSPAVPSPDKPIGVAPTMPALVPPPAALAPPLPPLRSTEVLPEPEPVAEAADWGAQALAALGTQAGVPLSLGTVGPGTGMVPSPLQAAPQASDPGPLGETFAYAPLSGPTDAWTAPQPVSLGEGMPPIEAAPAEATAVAELLDNEQMENDQTPVFVPVETSGGSAGQTYDEGPGPVLQASAFFADDEPADEPARVAQSMPASEEDLPRPAGPRTASQSQSAFATETPDDDSWQPPPSRRKKLIVMVAVAAGLGGVAAALLVGLLGKKPAEPLPVLRKTVAKKVAAPALPASKPAPAAKPALAEKTAPTEKPAAGQAPRGDKAAVDKVAAKALPAKATAVEATVAKAAPTTGIAASDKSAPTIAPKPAPAPSKGATPLAGGLVHLPVVSRPAGAMVWINGEERGKTPCTVDVKSGSARVVLVRAGHLTSQSTVQVREGAKIDETLKPVEPPMTGDARFRAECKTHGKLPIVVNGKETGILCPFSKMRVQPGSHTIGVLVPATGEVHTKDIILFAGVRSVVFGD